MRSLYLPDGITLIVAILLAVKQNLKCLATPFCSRGLHLFPFHLLSSKGGSARQMLRAFGKLNLEERLRPRSTQANGGREISQGEISQAM